jgi:hypothetical protein
LRRRPNAGATGSPWSMDMMPRKVDACSGVMRPKSGGDCPGMRPPIIDLESAQKRRDRHLERRRSLSTYLRFGYDDQISLKVAKYSTRCAAKMGALAFTVTGPPMVPKAKVT